MPLACNGGNSVQVFSRRCSKLPNETFASSASPSIFTISSSPTTTEPCYNWLYSMTPLNTASDTGRMHDFCRAGPCGELLGLMNTAARDAWICIEVLPVSFNITSFDLYRGPSIHEQDCFVPRNRTLFCH